MLALRYAAFALLATLANLALQRAVFGLFGPPFAYPLALGAGTIAGLVVKYLLDRRWIFFDRKRSLGALGRQFSLYTLTGVATTAIFWTSETTFWLIFGSLRMAQLGAVLGLTAGYVIKYRLDRRFVFEPG